MSRVTHFAFCAALVAAACSGRGPLDDPWALDEGACERHDDCDDGAACVERVCIDGAADAPLALAGVEASVWFDDPNGTCRWDSECGPWACVDRRCVAPETTDRYASVQRTDFVWWDGSCRTGADCGPWLCADNFCVAPGHVAPSAAPGVDPVPTGTVTCLADEMCPDGFDCVSPGRCVEGVADEPMTYFDIDATPFVTYDDGSCNYDADCGPWTCHEGWCMRPEYAGRDTLTRGDLRWFDGSCSGDADCGSWICVREFCADPDRFAVYAGDEDDASAAARAWRTGSVPEPIHDPRDPDPPLAPTPIPEAVEPVESQAAGEAGDEAVLLGVLGGSDTSAMFGPDAFEASDLEDLFAEGTFGDDMVDEFGHGAFAEGALDAAILDGGSTAWAGDELHGGGGLAVTSSAYDLSTGTSCLEQADCAPGGACVAPGWCQEGRLDEAMTVNDIDASTWFDHPDGACTRDDECGPWGCDDGTCAPWSDLGVEMPIRRSFRFYDLSCSTSADCGDWTCSSGFCNPI